MSINTVADRLKADVMDEPVPCSCCISSIEMNTIDLHKIIAGDLNKPVYLLAHIKPQRTSPLA